MGDGKKFDTEKRDWTLLPFTALDSVVQVMEHGERKYERDNWQLVSDGKRRYLAAAFRHLIASLTEYNDPESGLPHLAHAVCCLLFILHIDQEENQNEKM